MEFEKQKLEEIQEKIIEDNEGNDDD